MVLAYHIVLGLYGFWLPNDPRGSYSDFVGAWDLFRSGGKATRDRDTREGLSTEEARSPERSALKRSLKFPAVRLSGQQALAVAQGFARGASDMELRFAACAIMPDHIHMVLTRQEMAIERVLIRLKSEATRSLVQQGIHPLAKFADQEGRPPKCFSRGAWTSYLNAESDVRSAIHYVEQNPIREGLKPQRWSFVKPTV